MRKRNIQISDTAALFCPLLLADECNNYVLQVFPLYWVYILDTDNECVLEYYSHIYWCIQLGRIYTKILNQVFIKTAKT